MVLDDGGYKYVYGLGLAYAVDSLGNTLTQHTDGLGSVRAETDSSGNVVQTYGTDEFGIVDAALTSGTQPTPFQYTGEPRDSETGLVYLRARSYDPAVGRFMQADPLRKSGPGVVGWNRYAYVANNPIRFLDPTGFTATGANPEAPANPHAAPDSASNGALTIAQVAPPMPLPWPGTGLRGLDIDWKALAAAIIAAAAGALSDQNTPDRLYRFGLEYESADSLERQSEAALASGLPHGVSVFTRSNRLDAVSAPFSAVAAVFAVLKTGRSPFHYTVVLPHQVTPEAAEVFNLLFGRVNSR